MQHQRIQCQLEVGGVGTHHAGAFGQVDLQDVMIRDQAAEHMLMISHECIQIDPRVRLRFPVRPRRQIAGQCLRIAQRQVDLVHEIGTFCQVVRVA